MAGWLTEWRFTEIDWLTNCLTELVSLNSDWDRGSLKFTDWLINRVLPHWIWELDCCLVDWQTWLDCRIIYSLRGRLFPATQQIIWIQETRDIRTIMINTSACMKPRSIAFLPAIVTSGQNEDSITVTDRQISLRFSISIWYYDQHRLETPISIWKIKINENHWSGGTSEPLDSSETFLRILR